MNDWRLRLDGRRFLALFLGIGLLLGLAGCQTTAELAALPTRAVAAVAPAGMVLIDGVPATWTPLPEHTPDPATNFNRLDPAGATSLPSATPIFPSRTPRPPTATPTIAVPTRDPAEPYVAIIPTLPPTDALGPSKLGLHVIRNNDPNIMEFVRRGQPAVIKAVDDLGFLADVKEASPWTVTVGRIEVQGGPHYETDPEQSARDFVADQLESYRANPAVDYWEGYNEPDPNMNNMPWYARFEAERVRVMAQYGLRAAIGGFATGVPEYDEFALFVPAIAVAKEHRGILTLHEYGAPDMTYLYGDPLPGLPTYPDRGSLTFRYRWFYRDFLEPAGLVIPLVISEAGIDGIIGNRPGPDGLGWADFQDYWVQQGWGPDGTQSFINQLAWYDVGTRQDGYVIGFTIFTAGGFGYWKNYDINPILPQLADYVAGQR